MIRPTIADIHPAAAFRLHVVTCGYPGAHQADDVAADSRTSDLSASGQRWPHDDAKEQQPRAMRAATRCLAHHTEVALASVLYRDVGLRWSAVKYCSCRCLGCLTRAQARRLQLHLSWQVISLEVERPCTLHVPSAVRSSTADNRARSATGSQKPIRALAVPRFLPLACMMQSSNPKIVGLLEPCGQTWAIRLHMACRSTISDLAHTVEGTLEVCRRRNREACMFAVRHAQSL